MRISDVISGFAVKALNFVSSVFYVVRKFLVSVSKSAPFLAVLVSLMSLYLAWTSLGISQSAAEDNRLVAGLEVEPKIQFRAQFYEISNGSIARPPNFVISNSGPVSAVQTRVELIYHEYNLKAKQFDFSFSGTEAQYFEVGNLEPLEIEAYLVDENFISYPNLLGSERIGVSVLEARISYRRDSDKKLYVANSLYFFNDEGKWVSELDTSLENKLVGKEVVDFVVNNYYDSPDYSDPIHFISFDSARTYSGKIGE